MLIEMLKKRFYLTYKLHGSIWLKQIVTFKKYTYFALYWVQFASTSCYSILRSKKQKQFFVDEISTCSAIKKRLQHTCFSVKFATFLRTHFFYRTTPVAATEQTQEISVVHCVAKWCSGHLAQVYLSYPISC